MLLAEKGGVFGVVRAHFHEDESLSATAESVLEDDEENQKEACADGNDWSGDEETVTLSGLGEDEEVDGADEDAESDEDEDEEDDVGGFGSEREVQGPVGGIVGAEGVEAVLAFDFGDVGGDELDGFLWLQIAGGGDREELDSSPTAV